MSVFLVGEGGWRHQYLYCFLEYLQNEVEAKENFCFFRLNRLYCTIMRERGLIMN